MEVEQGRQSPHSSRLHRTSESRRRSTSSVGIARTASAAGSRQSDDTALVSDSAFQTPDPGVSTLSLPPLSFTTSANVRDHDESRQSDQLRDSGIDTSTSTNRLSGPLSLSLPNLAPLMPAGDDRPDLWRIDHEPPTFRPRIQGNNAAVDFADIGLPDNVQNRARPPPRGFRRVFAFLGYGTDDRYRKELVTLTWTFVSGFIQVAVTFALMIYSSIHRSPKQPSISEWTACDKPLGVWSIFWIVKVVLDCCMTYWGWRRDWKGRQRRQGQPEGDVEQNASGVDTVAPVDTNMDPPMIGPVDRQRRRVEARSVHPRLYSRLSLLLSLIIISWFLTTNIFLFTSLTTCRFAAPHLWWLVFSLLCLQYLVILEVFATAVVVFIIGPIIFLFWSIILICLGRHPIQNPNYISPEIGKVSRSIVDQIPLVLYIPSPPDDEKISSDMLAGDVDAAPKPEPISTSKAELEHTYPPKRPIPKRRFLFLRRKSSKSSPESDNAEKTTTSGEKSNKWEDCWESGEFPFVRLEANRASCAICLLDFEEPRRRVAKEVIRSWMQDNKKGKDGVAERKSQEGQVDVQTSGTDAGGASSPNQASSAAVQQDASVPNNSENEDGIAIRLEDSGEGAQPLRLLKCGHAFHKTCIDPWLTDVSGRCPTCQRPVFVPDPPKKKRNRDEQE